MNRTIAPELQPIETIQFSKPIIKPITETSELYWIKDVSDETVRFELHFNAGTVQGELLIANLTNSLLLSGTNDKTTNEIHEELALLGAYVSTQTSLESAAVSVYCLRENLEATLEILYDAIANVTFPLSELEDLLRDRKQAYQVDSQKMDVLARRVFRREFFQNDKRYGRNAVLEDYDHIDVEDLRAFHQQFYKKGLERIVCVANIEETLIDKWIARFSSWSNQQELEFMDSIKNNAVSIYEEQEDAIQTAIRLGIPLFNKVHDDYTGVFVLHTILGAYFGSRLMSNLREDKGYTYGIGSAILETQKAGYFIIATEVKKEVQEDALKQIMYEINRLKTELISEAELQLVKNYLLGQLLKGADGSDAMMDLFINVHLYGLELSFYNDMIEAIKTINSQELLNLANSYLDTDKMTVVRVG